MNYQPKVIRCRLKTGGKSIPQIREECRGQGLTYRDFENIQRSNEEFDGLVVLLSLWAYDNRLDELDVSGVPELDDLLVDPGVELEGWNGDADECYVYDDGDDGDRYGIYDYEDDDGDLYGDNDYQETSGRSDAPILA